MPVPVPTAWLQTPTSATSHSFATKTAKNDFVPKATHAFNSKGTILVTYAFIGQEAWGACEACVRTMTSCEWIGSMHAADPAP